MVGANTLKDYDFETIENYFDYISSSIVNGQTTQARNLTDKLSLKQKKYAIEYFETTKDVDAKILVIGQL